MLTYTHNGGFLVCSSIGETDLYETDKKMQKKIELDCQQGVKAQLERMKELCKGRNDLYDKQNDLKGQKQKIEKSLER